MRNFVKSSLLFAALAGAVLALSSAACLGGVIYHVTTTGSDSHSGYSWTQAKATVQAAINTAHSGDEVWVAKGDYHQTFTVLLKAGVALYGGFAGTETARGQRDWTANVTILDGNQAGPVVTCPSGLTSATVIDGFTIQNGNATYGGGIYCDNSAPAITNNTITGNTASGGGSGGGIYCNHSSPTISGNTITKNTAGDGGGIYSSNSSATISSNTIVGNTASGGGGYGGGIDCFGGSPTVTSNTITGNTATGGSSGGYGGGIYCDGSAPGISNNIITTNAASDGGGINCHGGSPAITSNTITGNIASIDAEGYGGYGGGIYCDGSSLAITNNTITENTAPGNTTTGGGGIYCYTSSPAITNNIIAFNSEGIGSAGSPTLRNNCVYGNNGVDYSGLYPGTTDLFQDPLFVASGNYHLRPGSPCIDSGNRTFAPLDPDGTPPDIGAFPYFHLDAVKTLADASPVSLTSLVATMGADDGAGRVYFQDLAGASGIWVQTTATPNRGATEDVTGAIATDAVTGERYIAAATVTATTAENPPNPLTMRPEWLGGGVFGASPLGQPGVTGGSGLNNIGLLVRTYGVVTASTSTSFTLQGGSGVDVDVMLPAGVTAPSVGSFVAVTGISDCEKVGTELNRLLRVRGQGDITGL